MYINKVILYGNLTRDPELKSTTSGMSVCNFSIATNRSFKDKEGTKQEQTEYHSIVIYGKTAETVNVYLKKGSGVYIEGRLQTRSWDDKTSGEKKFRTEIVGESVQFGPRSTTPAANTTASGINALDKVIDSPKAGPGIDYPKDEINADDIPF